MIKTEHGAAQTRSLATSSKEISRAQLLPEK